MNITYDKDYFIRFVSEIQDEAIVTCDDYINNKDTYQPEGRWPIGQHVMDQGMWHPFMNSNRFKAFCALRTGWYDIEAGKHPDFQQETPKQRILAALEAL